MPEKVVPGFIFASASEVYTRRLITWLSENPLHESDLQHFWEVTERMPESSETAVSALRFAILRQMLPLQTSHQPGPKLELECMLLECALNLIDWHRVMDFLKPHVQPPGTACSN